MDILCGGFPCQVVSTVGKRAGLAPGTRSGLWAHRATAIDALQPEWVVIENVRGLLSAPAVRPSLEGDAEERRTLLTQPPGMQPFAIWNATHGSGRPASLTSTGTWRRTRLQLALPETSVVKTLNTVGGPIGVNPTLLSAPTHVFLSGDSPEAKAIVAELLADLEWAPDRQIDLGGIATARAAEHYFLLFWALAGALRIPAFNIAIIAR